MFEETYGKVPIKKMQVYKWHVFMMAVRVSMTIREADDCQLCQRTETLIVYAIVVWGD
jgi:hypothetical protein